MASSVRADPASFRDPGGTVYFRNGTLLRQINGGAAQNNYEHLMRSGLYDVLAEANLLVGHEQAGLAERYSDAAGVVIRPERVPFISYPYEWCFGQLKDAALLTLRVQRDALGFGMSLKDASAYNVQFWRGSRPVLIDTLSFERYIEGTPWVAYRQFCQHFLAPLALIARGDARLGRLSQIGLDGVPLDLAARLLPSRCRLDPALLVHVYLHRRAQQRHASDAAPPLSGQVSREAFLGLLDSLEAGIRRLDWRPGGTPWADYYDDTNYDDAAFAAKKRLVARLFAAACSAAPVRRVCDLGANTGVFSRVASEQGVFTLSLDMDPAAVEKNYQACRASGEQNLLPLVQDLTSPSGGVGWAGEERAAFLARWTATQKQEGSQDDSADVAFVLALVHHLAIGNNVPLAHVARLLSCVARFLLIEWVPGEDSQVKRLLARRPSDAFADYTEATFEAAFAAYFTIQERAPIPGTVRVLYLLRARSDPSAAAAS